MTQRSERHFGRIRTEMMWREWNKTCHSISIIICWWRWRSRSLVKCSKAGDHAFDEVMCEDKQRQGTAVHSACGSLDSNLVFSLSHSKVTTDDQQITCGRHRLPEYAKGVRFDWMWSREKLHVNAIYISTFDLTFLCCAATVRIVRECLWCRTN